MKAMPESVQDVFGFALYLAQLGEKHPDAKPLKGFSGAGVLEIIENLSSDTYRAVYTVRYDDAVYVLHVFQKKSKHGIATPKEEIEIVKTRLKMLEEIQQRKRNEHHE
ncbi:MAG: type II toxin-antitoxin system RelE/ParE family toxin [Syntrophobacteraceae bacterium]